MTTNAYTEQIILHKLFPSVKATPDAQSKPSAYFMFLLQCPENNKQMDRCMCVLTFERDFFGV